MNIPSTNPPALPAPSRPGKQRGAVLILALLIVALVAGLGIKFAGDYQLGLARAEGRWHGAQARAYSFSGEGAAVRMLSQDSTPYDSLDEPWAAEMPLPVEGGIITISIIDANSQININTVTTRAGGVKPVLDPSASPTDPNRYTVEQRRFLRLLQLFPEMVPGVSEAAGILEAMVDWVDDDDNPSGSYGAESNYYLGLSDPYQAANNGLFRSVEELQMVRGITPQLMRALRPYITVASGTSQNTVAALNVNTMLPLLYRCINTSTDLQPLDEAAAQALAPPAGGPYYKDMAEFDAAATKVLAAGYDKDGLSVSTGLFWLKTQSEIGDQRRIARSLLERGTPLFKVIRREEVY